MLVTNIKLLLCVLTSAAYQCEFLLSLLFYSGSTWSKKSTFPKQTTHTTSTLAELDKDATMLFFHLKYVIFHIFLSFKNFNWTITTGANCLLSFIHLNEIFNELLQKIVFINFPYVHNASSYLWTCPVAVSDKEALHREPWKPVEDILSLLKNWAVWDQHQGP